MRGGVSPVIISRHTGFGHLQYTKTERKPDTVDWENFTLKLKNFRGIKF